MMEWLQVLTIAGSTVGACWWMHEEHKSDIKSISDQMSREAKDFHARLCTIEERYLQMMQRLLEKKDENVQKK